MGCVDPLKALKCHLSPFLLSTHFYFDFLTSPFLLSTFSWALSFLSALLHIYKRQKYTWKQGMIKSCMYYVWRQLALVACHKERKGTVGKRGTCNLCTWKAVSCYFCAHKLWFQPIRFTWLRGANNYYYIFNIASG